MCVCVTVCVRGSGVEHRSQYTLDLRYTIVVLFVSMRSYVPRVSSSGGDRGEASPPNSLASPPKNLTLIKLSIIVSQ